MPINDINLPSVNDVVIKLDPNSIAAIDNINNSNTYRDPTRIDIDAIQTKKTIFEDKGIDRILDKDWGKQAFLLDKFINYPDAKPGSVEFEAKVNYYNRFYTTAHQKFYDTKLGGSIGVNARPQYTRYSDIRVPGLMPGRNPNVSVEMIGGLDGDSTHVNANYGMGSFYSESLDDNTQTIYMRFGVPQFSSLANYISAAYDPDLASLARTGRAKSAFYTAGSMTGGLLAVGAFPFLGMAYLTSRVLAGFFRTPNSKFYTMKPTMHTYWGIVNSLVNTIAINSGLLPRFLYNDKDQKINTNQQLTSAELEMIHNMLPDIIDKDHGYDIFAMAGRAQRIANAVAKAEYDGYNAANNKNNFFGVAKRYLDDSKTTNPGSNEGLDGFLRALDTQYTTSSLANFVIKNLSFGYYTLNDKDTGGVELADLSTSATTSTPEVNNNQNPIPVAKDPTKDNGWFQSFTSLLDSEMKQGSEFAIFKVDYTGSVSESFSNSTVESELARDLNNISSSNRESRFKIADGNLANSGDGILGATTELAADAVKATGDFLQGIVNGATFGAFGGVSALSGNGFFDIPKHWQSSSVSLPRASYSMTLISPYANVISQLQNMYIPLSMIMAGSIPLSTGKFTYTSPLLCQVFDRGRCQIKLGMVESLQITRGSSNLPFTNKCRAMAIDVSFSVVDLSSIMHMPIPTGTIFGTRTENDPDNLLMDYISVLAGQDIYTQVYNIPRAKINIAERYSRLRTYISPANWASYTNNSLSSGWMSWLFPISIPYKIIGVANQGNSQVVTDNGLNWFN